MTTTAIVEHPAQHKAEAEELSARRAVGGPFAWLVQSTTERNPPHGWAVHMFNGQQAPDAVPVYLQSYVDRLRNERDDCRRALFQAQEAAKSLIAKGEMLAAVVQGAKEEFVRVPYGASHEDVAAINDWHKMAGEALAAWENQ